MKKTTTKAHGRRAAKIRVTSTGKPPLSGAKAFARLLVAVYNKNPAALTSQECGDPTSPRSDR
ncbi:MAG: hypothetical protein ACYC0P_03765 [Thiobacillus sp.]